MSKRGEMKKLFFFCDRCGTTVKKEDERTFIKLATGDDGTDKLCPQCFKYRTDMVCYPNLPYTELISGVSEEKKTSLLIFEDNDDVEKKFTGIYENVGYQELYGLNNETKMLTWLCATPAGNFTPQCNLHKLCVAARFAFKIEHKLPIGKEIQGIPFHTEIIRPDFCVECPLHFDRKYLVQWFHDMYQESAQELFNLFMKNSKSFFEIREMNK